MERADAGRAVSEVADADAVGAAQLFSECETVGDGQPRSHDARGEHEARGRVRQMHRPALAFAGARHLAVELSEDGVERRALRYDVVDAAVGGGHEIVGTQRSTDAGGDRLLAADRVVLEHDLARAESAGDRLVTLVDAHHGAVKSEHGFVGEGGGRGHGAYSGSFIQRRPQPVSDLSLKSVQGQKSAFHVCGRWYAWWPG